MNLLQPPPALDRNLLALVKQAFVPMPGGQAEPVAAPGTMTAAQASQRPYMQVRRMFCGRLANACTTHASNPSRRTHAEDRVYVVFSTKLPQPHRSHWAEAAQGSWSVEFDSGGVKLQAHNLGRCVCVCVCVCVSGRGQ